MQKAQEELLNAIAQAALVAAGSSNGSDIKDAGQGALSLAQALVALTPGLSPKSQPQAPQKASQGSPGPSKSKSTGQAPRPQGKAP
jgi:hypothetical protein